ncbi:hypothetical protein H257_12546 [Aphanomyces astaci]|uniref:Uncharacterized protein n=1 Tax=Aphanomyces astaci TaxID=112090 RepID=W4G027_APHAT|nr:hypothetical protein H257_12546 [Aphanomyces astaci]ETV72409.1 hypothetical protein H257_12546 [Aphanomyces astaci]|eukprot:XP_009838091.1 hypothetical protein H257_12546 [Aphanomyces astaci]
MATNVDTAAAVMQAVECMLQCIEVVHLIPPTSNEVALTVHAMCIALSFDKPWTSMFGIYGTTCTLMQSLTPLPSLILSVVRTSDDSHETQEMARLVKSCVQDIHKHRLTRTSSFSQHHKDYSFPTAALTPVLEDPLEERWTDTGGAVYARKNVFHEAFAPITHCRRYAKVRRSDAAIYKALRVQVRQNLVAREVNRIAKLNHPHFNPTHDDSDNADGGEPGEVDEYDHEGTTKLFHYQDFEQEYAADQ